MSCCDWLVRVACCRQTASGVGYVSGVQAFFEHFQSLPGQQRLIGYTVYGDQYYAGPGQDASRFLGWGGGFRITRTR
jgi:hypothetical protein